MMVMEKKIELLAPAGTKEAFYAAIHAGCNAIYLGGKSFSARAFANNFSFDELEDLISYAHIRDVKVYVTVNTLIFDDEIEKALEWIDFLYTHDVDALILQDLGLASLIHERYPDFPMHASTQINCHNVSMARKLKEIGFTRIVLARETPFPVIQEIKKIGIEVEVFIHGALCVSYSGNCLMSSFIGKRSGNRGRCAQPCRMENSIVGNDGEKGNYSISTRDLETLEQVHRYQESGIDSLKIEGRMKRDEYVYAVVSIYRLILQHQIKPEEIPAKRTELAKLFNRGFTKGFSLGANRLEVLNQNTSNHQGTFLGIVQNVHKNFVYVLLEDSLSIGDGIRFLGGEEEGMTITNLSVGKSRVTTAQKGMTVSFARHDRLVKPGMRVMKTTDRLQILQIQQEERKEKEIPITATFRVDAQNYFTLTLRDERGNIIQERSSIPAEKAEKTATSKERIEAQLKKTGDDPYRLVSLEFDIPSDLYFPISELNALRRNCLSKLNEARKVLHSRFEVRKEIHPTIPSFSPQPFSYLLQVENEEQLQVALSYPWIRDIYVSNDLYQKYQTYPQVKKQSPRVMFHDNQAEEYTLCHSIKESVHATLSPYGNVTNTPAALFYLQNGYDRIILSYECSAQNLKNISRNLQLNATNIPLFVPIYGRMDLMLLESCPIATSRKQKHDHCMLCKKDSYYLKDRMNSHFPLLSTKDCQIRVLHEKPLYLFDALPEIKSWGYQGAFLTFTIESAKETKAILDTLQLIHEGKMPSCSLKATTTGHFYKGIQ